CKGLCPECGADRNKESCGCGDAIDPDNPFYALKDLVR
ncbi:MAG TPA: metal-binding protein, partial [Coriobacteriia bacterium]|nr:metal-binding protein [Coriobacteriia bacterium]